MRLKTFVRYFATATALFEIEAAVYSGLPLVIFAAFVMSGCAVCLWVNVDATQR